MAKVKSNVASYLKANFKKARVIAGRSEFLQFNTPKHWISTGLRPLDIAIGGKGIPTGRVILISADASLGKTLLGLHLARAFQERGGTVHFIETEGTVDPNWIENLGVDLSEDKMVQPDISCLEDLFEYVEMAGLWHMKEEPNRPVLFYVDSLSMCPPGKVLQKTYGDALKQKGAKAAILSGFLERLETKLRRSSNTLLFISQLRSKISMNPMQPIMGDQQAVAGGAALGFYNSLHLRLRQVYGSEIYNYADAKKRDRVFEQEGMEVEVFVHKSKISYPHRKGYLTLYWRETERHPAGFDALESDLNWLADRELIHPYLGKDKVLVKAKATEIHLPSGTKTFVGVSGWKKMLANKAMYDEVGHLMMDNAHSRCAKDEVMERSSASARPLKGRGDDDEEGEAMSASARQLSQDMDNLEDEAPDFSLESANETPRGKKAKAKKGRSSDAEDEE